MFFKQKQKRDRKIKEALILEKKHITRLLFTHLVQPSRIKRLGLFSYFQLYFKHKTDHINYFSHAQLISQ